MFSIKNGVHLKKANTVRFMYNTIKCYDVIRERMQCKVITMNIKHTLNSRKPPHISPVRTSYEEAIVNILEKSNHVIIKLYCRLAFDIHIAKANIQHNSIIYRNHDVYFSKSHILINKEHCVYQDSSISPGACKTIRANSAPAKIGMQLIIHALPSVIYLNHSCLAINDWLHPTENNGQDYSSMFNQI